MKGAGTVHRETAGGRIEPAAHPPRPGKEGCGGSSRRQILAGIDRPSRRLFPRRRMAECLRAASVDHTPNRLFRVTLPLDLAQRFLQVLKAAQGEVNTVLGEEGNRLFIGAPVRPRAARLLPTGSRGSTTGLSCWSFPRFIQQFDSPDLRGEGNGIRWPSGMDTAAPHRDAPSSGNLEVHHVQYRGRGGGDEESNKVLLCLCHHQKGEHIGMMHVRGEAPLNLGYRLGPKERGVWFRNEKVHFITHQPSVIRQGINPPLVSGGGAPSPGWRPGWPC